MGEGVLRLCSPQLPFIPQAVDLGFDATGVLGNIRSQRFASVWCQWTLGGCGVSGPSCCEGTLWVPALRLATLVCLVFCFIFEMVCE